MHGETFEIHIRTVYLILLVFPYFIVWWIYFSSYVLS